MSILLLCSNVICSKYEGDTQREWVNNEQDCVSALLQHVSRSRQPLEDAGCLLHGHFLYPSSSITMTSTQRGSWVFSWPSTVSQRWTWQTLVTTLCWSCRWAGLSLGAWLTSTPRSTSWSRWNRRSLRASGGGELSRWGDQPLRLVGATETWQVNSLIVWLKQVIHNWTIPLHAQRSEQILVTRTFEMVSRYSELSPF